MNIPKKIGILVVVILMTVACKKDEVKPETEHIEDKALTSFPLVGTWARYSDGSPGDDVYRVEVFRIGKPGIQAKYGDYKKQILEYRNGQSRLVDNEEGKYFARKSAHPGYDIPDNATDDSYYVEIFFPTTGKEKKLGLTHRSYSDNPFSQIIWNPLFVGSEHVFFNEGEP